MTKNSYIIFGSAAFLVISGAVWYMLYVHEYVPAGTNDLSMLRAPVTYEGRDAAYRGETAASATTTVTSTPVAQPSAARTLDLSGQGLTKVPMNVFDRTDLESLNVSHNALRGALQAEIRHLSALRTLDLSHNDFTGVPAEVGQLRNLEVLDLSHNPITGLPYEMGNLSNLKRLDLRGTQYAKQDLAIIRAHLPPTTDILTD